MVEITTGLKIILSILNVITVVRAELIPIPINTNLKQIIMVIFYSLNDGKFYLSRLNDGF